MYLGGLQVLQDPSNPDRVAQAAHSMRELMEKVGELERPAEEGSASTGSMKDRIFKLKEALDKAKRNAEGYTESGAWEGPFDEHLYRFLSRVDEFFEWVDSDRPSRRTLFQRAMTRLDASGQALPPPLRNRRYRGWQKMWNFFQKTSHHRSFPSLNEMRDRIGDLEAFLASMFVPKTFEDLDAIDALLEEAGDA